MPELLEDSIRATAPVPTDDFLARLDARVDAGFAKEPTPTRAPRKRRVPWLLQPAGGLVAVVLIGVLVSFGAIAAVVGGGGTDESGSSGSAIETSSDGAKESFGDDSASGSSSAGSGAVAESAPASPAPDSVAPGAERRVVERSTQLDLSTPADRFDETTAGVLRAADRTGTIVASSDVSEDGGRGTATYDLRVPTSRVDETLAALSELGKVTSRSSSTQDITATSVSARDDLADARDRRAALLKALERADTDGERASIERRLRSARRQIAAAEARVREVAARGNRARVDVTVRSTKPEAGAWTPGDALDDAGAILQWVAGVALVGGAVLLPLALVIAALVGTSRLTRRRRREAALG